MPFRWLRAALLFVGCTATIVAAKAAWAAPLSWGHLAPSWQLLPGQRLFLINQPPGVPYRVCISSALEAAFPSLPAEIDAAVNTWASYLGRRIVVETKRKDLPAIPRERREKAAEDLFKACGEGFDLALALAPMSGQALGETGFKRTTIITTSTAGESRRVELSPRYLYLRDLVQSPLISQDGEPLKWLDYTDLFAAGSRTEQSILSRIQARSSVHYSVDGGIAMLSVLIHEFGHVWGLCDLYPSQQGCDAAHSGQLPLPAGRYAMMGPTYFRQQLYLADDDIAGIRALAARPGFQAGWPKTPGLTATPPKVVLPPVEALSARLVKADRSSVTLACHIITNRPTRYRFEAKRAGETAWLQLTDEVTGSPRIYLPEARIKVQTIQNSRAMTFRLWLDYLRTDGKWAPPQTVPVTTN